MNLTTHDLVTWKEQGGVFGAGLGYLKGNPAYPQISYNLKMTYIPQDDGFFYVLIHELGHVIDFYNHISDNGGTWMALSWQAQDPNAINPDMGNPLVTGAFWQQTNLCWEGACPSPGAVSLKDAAKFYQSLRASAFPTAYAGFSRLEDFAENWAWYVMRKFKSPNYQVSIPGEGNLDLNGMFVTSPMLARKQAYIDHLWTDPSLRLTPVSSSFGR